MKLILFILSSLLTLTSFAGTLVCKEEFLGTYRTITIEISADRYPIETGRAKMEENGGIVFETNKIDYLAVTDTSMAIPSTTYYFTLETSADTYQLAVDSSRWSKFNLRIFSVERITSFYSGSRNIRCILN